MDSRERAPAPTRAEHRHLAEECPGPSTVSTDRSSDARDIATRPEKTT
jgi:hypothetical protein